MKLEIEKRIFEVFPDAKIGWLLAEVKIEPSNEYVESMKKGLIGRLKDIGILVTYRCSILMWQAGVKSILRWGLNPGMIVVEAPASQDVQGRHMERRT